MGFVAYNFPKFEIITTLKSIVYLSVLPIKAKLISLFILSDTVPCSRQQVLNEYVLDHLSALLPTHHPRLQTKTMTGFPKPVLDMQVPAPSLTTDNASILCLLCQMPSPSGHLPDYNLMDLIPFIPPALCYISFIIHVILTCLICITVIYA